MREYHRSARFRAATFAALSFLAATAAVEASDQHLLWRQSFGGGFYDFIAEVDTDASGNIYLTGMFYGTVDFDRGPGTAFASSNGDADTFLVKLDNDGNFVWVRSFGASQAEVPFSLTVDDSGNAVVTGSYHVVTDFDPGPGTAIPPMLGDADNPDSFVVKFDTNGDFQWVYPLNSADVVEAYATFDSNGDLLLTGEIEGSIDFDPGPGTANATITGNFEAYILKIDADGNFIWVATAPSAPATRGLRIVSDSQNNAIVTGELVGSVDVDPGAGTVTVNGAGTIDAFIWKLDSDGDYVWGGTVGGPQLDYGRAIAVDASDNILVGGIIQDTADMNPGAGVSNLTSAGDHDAFVLKLDPNGNFIWAVRAGDTGVDRVECIVPAPDGSLWALGAFEESPDFKPGPGMDVLTSTGTYNGFMWNLSAGGSHMAALPFRGTSTVEAWTGVFDSDDEFIIAGNFEQTMDASPDFQTHNLHSVALTDVFLVKLGDAPIPGELQAWPLALVLILAAAWTARRLRRHARNG